MILGNNEGLLSPWQFIFLFYNEDNDSTNFSKFKCKQN